MSSKGKSSEIRANPNGIKNKLIKKKSRVDLDFKKSSKSVLILGENGPPEISEEPQKGLIASSISVELTNEYE